MLKLRKSDERGGGDHGWLKSKHTFSFSNYHDPNFMGFGPLRVINEDWVAGGQGFPMHPHSDMEIITYVLSGKLEHRDSMGNHAVILPGEVQKMTAGTGVFHSEYNPDRAQEVHLLQIWIHANKKGLTPSYAQKSFEEQLNKEKIVLVVSPNSEKGSIGIAQDARLYISRLKALEKVEHGIELGRSVWVQMVKGKISINEMELTTGDGLAVNQESLLNISALEDAEFLVFDVK